MRHHKSNRIFGRKSGQRRALLRSLARSLILHNGIKTTEAKAKELRPFIETLVTKAKHDTVSSRRLLMSRLHSTEAVKMLCADISPRYEKRAGGYTRIVKLPYRKSDASSQAYIEFV